MQIAETTNANSTRFQYKVVLLGDAGVGKTSLIRRFCFNDFIMDTQETIGLRFHSMTIPAIQDGNTFVIGLSVWDFGGQERFRSILPQFITGANAALLAFDLTRLQSLENLNAWDQLLQENAGNVPRDLIGTKSDLIQDESITCVDSKKIDQWRVKLGALHYLETSAKMAHNTDRLFSQLIQTIVDAAHPEDNIQIL